MSSVLVALIVDHDYITAILGADQIAGIQGDAPIGVEARQGKAWPLSEADVVRA